MVQLHSCIVTDCKPHYYLHLIISQLQVIVIIVCRLVCIEPSVAQHKAQQCR